MANSTQESEIYKNGQGIKNTGRMPVLHYNFSQGEKLSFQEFLHPDIEYGSDVEG